MILTKHLNLTGRLCLIPSRQLRISNKPSPFPRTIPKSKKIGILSSLTAPVGGSQFVAGRGFLIGASAFGFGALCYYGAGLSSRPGILDRSLLWPSYVRERITDTYSYFLASVVFSAFSAYNLVKMHTFQKFMMNRPILSCIGLMVAVVGTGSVVRSFPYSRDVMSTKHIAWGAHLALVGALVSPMIFILGSQLALRAALMTAGVALSLSTIALCAPNERFLQYGGVLGIGLGIVAVSNIASMFVPVATVAGSWLYSMSVYGGLVLFSLFLLYDTQRVIKQAENPYVVYDPINMSLSIYLDVLNIFIRVLAIMGGTGNRRK